jgi:hypothetical protein
MPLRSHSLPTRLIGPSAVQAMPFVEKQSVGARMSSGLAPERRQLARLPLEWKAHRTEYKRALTNRMVRFIARFR